MLGAFGAQAAVALRQHRLALAVAEAEPLAEVDRTRTALLAAVSHDLRSPLASAKAAVSALRSEGVQWSEPERAELLATADESLDRLTRLVENLLDLSRLQAGALAVFPQPVGLEDVLPAVLRELEPAAVESTLELDLPEVMADPGLLERILVNVGTNAVRHSPPDRPPQIKGSAHRDRVEVRVIDFGPGVPEADWERIFVPFQRLGDRDNTTGVGLGLALSRGLAEAMGGTLEPENTPGGGLTMVLSLPAVPVPAEVRCREPGPGRRGRPAAAAGDADHPARPRARGGHRGHRPQGAVRGGRGPAGPGRARPRAARPGRRRGHRGPARLDQRADHRAVRPYVRRGQGGRARRRRRRLRDQAVRDRGAAGPDPRGDPAGGRPGRRRQPRRRHRPLAGRPRRPPRHRQRRHGGEVKLTPTEWKLLEAFVRHPGKLIGQRQLLTEVWGPAATGDTSSLRLYLNRLRRKLEPDPSRPRHLLTEPGLGYRFQP